MAGWMLCCLAAAPCCVAVALFVVAMIDLTRTRRKRDQLAKECADAREAITYQSHRIMRLLEDLAEAQNEARVWRWRYEALRSRLGQLHAMDGGELDAEAARLEIRDADRRALAALDEETQAKTQTDHRGTEATEKSVEEKREKGKRED